ncbi:MAG TPA: hypothetical protein PLL53_19360 [Saprospiraceae bacterium]|nr:hypothetical protein [Saprospiraceae bacterium]
MKNFIALLLLTSVFFKSYSQDFKKQVLTFTDEKKETVVIPEFLVYDTNTKEYKPHKVPFKDFYDYKKNPLGIRFFNFGCIKTKKSGFWLGQIDKDSKGHAIFKEPIYGIRAMVMLNAEIIEERNKNTLLKFFNVYAPSTDCVGSLTKDKDGNCPKGYNKPDLYAKKVGDAIGLGINDKLLIRDKEGNLDVKLMTLIMNEVAQFETGKKCKFTEETILRAINLDNETISIDDFVKANFKMPKIKKTLIGQNFQCEYKEVYLVEGFTVDEKLKERFMVYNRNGIFIKSDDFIKWCAEQISFFEIPEIENIDDNAKSLNLLQIKYENGLNFLVGYEIQSDIPENIPDGGRYVSKYVSFIQSDDVKSYNFPTAKECK